MADATATIPPASTLLDSPAPPPANQPPRPHLLQRRALDALSTELVDAGRAVVVMPSGTGKTFLARWFAEQIRARTVLVCVPSIALLAQTVLAYRAHASTWPHRTMIVCSDPTTGRAVELTDLSLPFWAREAVAASTSYGRISDFLDAPTPGARLIVSTFHSAPRVASALRHARRPADLLVCDEAHHLVGRPRREFRSVLLDHELPAQRRLFLTATPSHAVDAVDDDLRRREPPLSLEDPATFGRIVYRASHAQAVANKLLVDYDVQVLATQQPGHDPSTTPGAVDAVLTAIADGATRLLSFHSRVKHARALAAELDGKRLPDGRLVRAQHLEARHSASHRRAVLAQLASPAPGEVSVVPSARVLTEGVDVPAVDTVVFADPKTSATDIVQAIGRCMRIAPGKTRGRIVLPVRLPHDDLDPDTVLSSTAWRNTWIVLRALAKMDPRFVRTLRDAARQARGPRTAPPRSGPTIHVDLPDGLDSQHWILRALDRTGSAWWTTFDALARWAAAHGHAHPNSTLRVDGVALGQWVAQQRIMYRKGLLSDDQVAALERLHGWAWTYDDIAWWQGATRWLAFHAVPRPKDDPRLWEALALAPAQDPKRRCRTPYKSLAEFRADTCARRRRGTLPAHLERFADRLPAWRWHPLPPDDAAMVDALDEYAAWKNDLNPPHDYMHDDLPLGSWLTAVRRRRFTGQLHPALEHELAALRRHHRGADQLDWLNGDTAWRLAYLALCQFVERQRTCRVPDQHIESLPDHVVYLSQWCRNQRQVRRRGRLAPDRAAALERIPGWRWEVELREGYQATTDACGTRRGYAKGCRCEDCTAAHNAAYPNPDGPTDLVDAAKARGHVRILRGRGATQLGLARAAKVNPKTIAGIEDGTLKRIRPENDQAIRAVTLADAQAAKRPGRHATVPAGPTWELIHDMLRRGFPKAWISREIGGGPALQLKQTHVSGQNARAIRHLHDKLGSRRAPARGWREPLPPLDDLLAAEESARSTPARRIA